jgi:hypothetical protein
MVSNVYDTATVPYSAIIKKYAGQGYKSSDRGVTLDFAEDFARAKPKAEARLFGEISPAARKSLVEKLNAFASNSVSPELARRAAKALLVTGGVDLSKNFVRIFVEDMDPVERSSMIKKMPEVTRKMLASWLINDFWAYKFYPLQKDYNVYRTYLSDGKAPDNYWEGIKAILKLNGFQESRTVTEKDKLILIVRTIEYTPIGGGRRSTATHEVNCSY